MTVNVNRYHLDLDYVNMNQRTKYLGQRSVRLKHRLTYPTDCSIWTIKVHGYSVTCTK